MGLCYASMEPRSYGADADGDYVPGSQPSHDVCGCCDTPVCLLPLGWCSCGLPHADDTGACPACVVALAAEEEERTRTDDVVCSGCQRPYTMQTLVFGCCGDKERS